MTRVASPAFSPKARALAREHNKTGADAQHKLDPPNGEHVFIAEERHHDR